jgi:hypothetical protein
MANKYNTFAARGNNRSYFESQCIIPNRATLPPELLEFQRNTNMEEKKYLLGLLDNKLNSAENRLND